MVCGDHRNAAHLLNGINGLADTAVDCLNRRNRRVKDTGVSDHVAVCIVQDDDVELAALDLLDNLVAYQISAHLRLEIVGCNLRGCDQVALLVLVRCLDAAVEEERNMCILLGLRDAELRQTVFCDILAERVGQRLRLECDVDIRHGRIILRHADVVDREESLLALEAVKFRIDQRAGDLTGTVRTEVCKDNRIVGIDGCVLGDDNRNDELIGDAGVIRCLHRRNRIGIVLTLAVNHSGICLFHTLKAVVAVHGVVSALDGCDLADAGLIQLRLQFLDILKTRGRRNVTAVHEAMDIDLFQTVLLCQIDQAEDVLHVGVNTARAHQTVNMQLAVVLFAVVDCTEECLVLKEVAVLDGLGDTGQLLIDNAAGADVGVTDLTVAHLTVRQTDIQTGCPQLGRRILGENTVEIRRLCGMDGIAHVAAAQAKTVHNNQNQWFFHLFVTSL